MVEMFIREIREGIAETGVRAGILKCATDHAGMTPGVERVLRAVARAHRATGVPITTHTPDPPSPGAWSSSASSRRRASTFRVSSSATAAAPSNTDYHLALIENGSFIGFDHFGMSGITLEDRVDAVVRLCDRGYAERIVLSHDAMCFVDWFPRSMMDAPGSGAGPTFRRTYCRSMRARGVSEADIESMLVKNPRKHPRRR